MTTRRSFLATTGVAVLAAACGSSTKERAAPEETKTFVLLHGAWHGGWCWKRVEERLRAAGHHVYTPTQTGLGERSHLLSKEITLDVFIDDLVNVLEWEDLTDVVLVGHSFGGIVTSGAADRASDRIRQLIYLDSLIIQNGQTVFSTMPPQTVADRRRLAQESTGGLAIPVPDTSFFGVTDADDAAWLKAKCTPHPLSTYESPLTLQAPVGHGLPVVYIAVKPEFAPAAGARAFAKQQNWKYVEIDAGHDAMVTSPKALADTLLSL